MAIPYFKTLRYQVNKNPVVTLLLLILVVGIPIAFYTNKSEILPVFFVSLISAGVVYGTAQDSKNKLRLELFEKRYEIYEELMKILLYVQFNHKNDVEMKEVMVRDFCYNLKYHKISLMFGAEIEEQLRNLFSELRNIISRQKEGEGAEVCLCMEDMINKTITLFKPYLYFGDIKVGKI